MTDWEGEFVSEWRPGGQDHTASDRLALREVEAVQELQAWYTDGLPHHHEITQPETYEEASAFAI